MTAKPLVEFVVLGKFIAVELHTEAGARGYGDLPIDVRHLAADDDIVDEMVVVSVGRKGQVGGDGAEVQHRGELDAKFPRRSEEHTSELQSRGHLVCRLLLEKKNKRER